MLFVKKSGLILLLTLCHLCQVLACIGETETYGETQSGSEDFSDNSLLETDFRDGMLVVDLKLCSAFLNGKLFQVGMQFKLRHPVTNVEAQLAYQGLGADQFLAGQQYDCQEHTNISGSINKISVWTRTIAAGSSDTAIVWLQFSTTTGQVYNSNGSFFDAEGAVKYITFDTGIRGAFIGAFGTFGAQIDNLGFLYNPTTCTCEETQFLTTPAETVDMAASLSTGEASRAQLPAFITIFEAQERGVCAPYDIEIVESSDGETSPGPFIQIQSEELVLQSTDLPLKGVYNLQVKATLTQNTEVQTLSDPFDATLLIFETGPNFQTTNFVKVTEVKTFEASCFVDPDTNLTLVKQMKTDPGSLPPYAIYDQNSAILTVSPTSNSDHAGDEFTVVWECYIQEYVDQMSMYTEEIAVFILENTCDDYCQECTTTECTLCYATFDLTSDGKCECNPSKTFLDTPNEVCAPCLTNCETCSQAATCEVCQNTFTLSSDATECSCTQNQSLDSVNNVCIDCINNCEICSDSATCDQCFATFDLKVDKSECFCPEKTFEDTSNQQAECVDCLPNCKVCSDAATCDTCEDSFTLSAEKTSCTCLSNQFLDTLSNLCGDCPQNCAECQSVDTCDLCETGYLLFEDQSCILCDSQTHELDSDGNCVQKTVICPDNCVQCDLDTTCTECKPLFALNTAQNTCDPCPANCLECKADGTCQLCENTYTLSTDSTQCIAPCSSGQFLNTATSSCENCFANCIACQSANTCDTCDTGFELFQATQCIQCDLLTHEIDQLGNCVEIVDLPCPQHCETCDPTDGICTKCLDTFTLDTGLNTCSCKTSDGEFFNTDTQTCQSCLDPNCRYCSTSTNCNLCYPDYAVFQKKSCVFCNVFLNELDLEGNCVEKKVTVIDDGSNDFSSVSVEDKIQSLALQWNLPIAQFFLPSGNGPYLEDKFQDGNFQNGIELTTDFELDNINEGFSWSYKYKNDDPKDDPVFTAFWGTDRVRVNATIDCGPADVFVDCYHYEYRQEIFISSAGTRDLSLTGRVYPIKINVTNELNQYRTYTINIKSKGKEGEIADWQMEEEDYMAHTKIDLKGQMIEIGAFGIQDISIDMVGNMTLRYKIREEVKRNLETSETQNIILQKEDQIDRIYLELDMESVNREMDPELLAFTYKVIQYDNDGDNQALVKVDFKNPQEISLYETNQMRVIGKTKTGFTIFEQIINVPPQIYGDFWSKLSSWASLIIKWLLVGTIGSSVLLEIFIFQTYNFTALWQAAEIWQQVCYVHLLGIPLPSYALIFTPNLMPIVQFDFMYLVDKFYKKLIQWEPNSEGQQNLGINFVQFGFTSVHLFDNVDSVVFLAAFCLLIILFLFIPCVSRGCPRVSNFREDGLLVVGKTFLLMPLGVAAQIQLLYNQDEGIQTSIAILGLAYLAILMPICAIVRGIKQKRGCLTKLTLVLALRISTVLILVWGEKFLDYQVVALISIHVLFCLSCAHFFSRLQSARSPGFLWSYSLIPFLLFSLRMDSSGIFSNCVSAFILTFSAIEHVWIVDFSEKMRNFINERARSKAVAKQMRLVREHEIRKNKRQAWLDELKGQNQKTATEVELLGIAKTTEMDDESKVGMPTFEDEEDYGRKRRPSKLAASMGILGLNYSRKRKNKIAPIIIEEPREEDRSLSSKVQTPDDRAAEHALALKMRPKTPARNFNGSGLEDDAITGMGIKSEDDNFTMELVTGLNSPRSSFSLASPPQIVFRQPIDLEEKRESIFEPVSKVHYSRKASKVLQSMDGVKDLEISFSGQDQGMQSGIGSDLLRSHSQIDMESQKSQTRKPTIIQEKPSNDLLLNIPLDERDSNSYDVDVDIQVQDQHEYRKGVDDPNMLLFGPNWQFAGKKFDEKMNYKKMYKWKRDESRKRSIVAAQAPDINLDDSTQYQMTRGLPSKKNTSGGLTAQAAAEAAEADRLKQMEYPHIRQWIREIKYELDEDTQKIQRKWEREEKRVKAKKGKKGVVSESPERHLKTQANWNSQLGLTFDQEIREVMNNNIESFFESNSK